MLEIKFRTGEKEQWKRTPRKSASPNATPGRKRSKGKKWKAPSRRKRVKFEQTALGHYLYVYAPLQYYLVEQFCKLAQNKRNYDGEYLRARMIETIAMQSDNPTFRTARFRRALIDYRRNGHKPQRPHGWYEKDIMVFAKKSYYIHQILKNCTEW